MSFYEYFFDAWGSSSKELAVCCPFEHTTSGGLSYKEHNASAHVNILEGLFHCKVCDRGYNELSFIRAVLNCSMKDAILLQKVYKSPEDIDGWREDTKDFADPLALAKELGISAGTVKELDIISRISTDLSFPVFMYGHLIDIRMYVPGGKPKVKSRSGAPTGLVLPYDLWRVENPERVTLICAGEKDMAVARSHGFNAITLTGGENALPISPTEFKGRKIVIVYDNDDAGRRGANKLAYHLHPYAKWVKVCNGFHEVCVEDKEDITDFFVKYGKEQKDLVKYIEAAEDYVPQIDKSIDKFPIVSLREAASGKYIGKILRSNVQVVAMSETSYAMPMTMTAEKYRNDDTEGALPVNTLKTWELSDDTIQDLLHLVDGDFTEVVINKHCREILHVKEKEKYINLRKYDKAPVFKCSITDLFETTDADVVTMEFTAYSVGIKLESGKKYMITYKLVPHPYKGQQLTMLVTSATDANDSVTNFAITKQVKENLNYFKDMKGDVECRMTKLTEMVKHFLGYNGVNQLIQCIDLSYHTVLQFNFRNFLLERGYLDTFIVSESRVGKSSTANALRKLYKLGVFTSLAGSSATIPGLIGGSNKQGGSFQTRAGLIPQNHKGLIIFEEFGKSANNVITELTDIRSSNEVRITRVSGTLTLPALVRMITLTNVKASEGLIKPIASYPNGISVVTELVGAAEDIARYDMILVLSARGANKIDPFWEPVEPLPEEAYETRIRWVWSRTAAQVVITSEMERYIIEVANLTNQSYDCHIKIFGTEAWKKITRLAIAVAGYLVSTDESYEHIIVEKEHVDYAVQFLVGLYDNHCFRLKEYVDNEKKFSTIDEDGIVLLQDMFISNPSMLLHLEQNARTSKNTLQAVTGLGAEDYNKVMNKLVAGSFVQFQKYDITPTERFRLGMYKIDRQIRATRVGETSVTI